MQERPLSSLHRPVDQVLEEMRTIILQQIYSLIMEKAVRLVISR